MGNEMTAKLPKLPRYSFAITKAEHGVNWEATPDPEGSLCLYAEVQAAFAASNPSQETAELPNLPAFPIIVGRPWDAQDAIDYAHAAMQAGYEAGRASCAQREPLTDWPIHGIRVDQGTVVIVAKGNAKSADEAARWMCGALIAMKNGETK